MALKTTKTLIGCDIPDCTAEAEPGTPGWTNTIVHPPNWRAEKHLCPDCSAKVTIKQLTDLSAPPKKAAPAAAPVAEETK